MLVDFDTLPEESKVWIYPSSRKFYKDELVALANEISNFTSYWKKDAEAFQTAFEIRYDRFIILAANDSKSQLSTQELDESVQFILDLQEKYEVTLLDKLNVCFKQGEYVQYKELNEFKKLIKNKSVSKKSIIFDNLISNLGDYKAYWEIPITESWYNRFLK